jgi:acyl dehydratase
MAVTTLHGPDDVRSHLGKHLGYSEWMTIDQARVNLFAEATGDHQWIHVDVERAKAGPFGAPIAHGYLTLSLIAGFSQRNLAIDDSPMSVNYGLNKVRFPNPVRVGTKVRARMTLQSCEPIEGGPAGKGGLQLVTVVTIEIEGASKPACVAETVRMIYA